MKGIEKNVRNSNINYIKPSYIDSWIIQFIYNIGNIEYVNQFSKAGEKMSKAGRPKKYTEVEIMQQKIDEYFKECEIKHEPYTITGLCLALDICRDTL